MQVVWSPSALQEVLDIHDYVARDNPPAARRLAEDLVAATDNLRIYPHIGRPVRGDLRELVVRHNYIIRYEITGGQVTILRVRHARRRPD